MIELKKCKYYLCRSLVYISSESWSIEGYCTKKCKYKSDLVSKRHESKNKIFDYIGDKCVRCGVDDRRVLCFHHVDPDQKKFDIAKKVNLEFSLLKIELDKCVVLCENCHAIVHIERDPKFIKVVKFCTDYLNETAKGDFGMEKCTVGRHEVYKPKSKKRLESIVP